MRINIPAFRLPAEVLDEEIGYIVDMGVDVRYNTPVESLKTLADSGEYDAVFVGSGAPKGKELEIPGRHDSDQVFIGIEWLESIHFGHVDSVGKRVAHHRRRQHRDGLLPLGQAPRRHRREGHRAQDAQVLQGVAVGARGRRRGAGRDPREPAAGALHRRERNAHRHGVREVQLRRGERPAQTGNHRPRNHPVRHGRARDRPGQRVPVDRARHGDRVRQVGHAGGGQDHVHVHAARHLLRRRRGVRPGEHHLGGRAGPPGGDLHPQPLPGGRRSPSGRRRA